MSEELEQDVIRDLVTEYSFAKAKYPPYASLHEGFAVIFEELDELWDEIKKKGPDRDAQKLYNEAIQVASTAFTQAVFIKTNLLQKGDHEPG